jgi:hypothetical protein
MGDALATTTGLFGAMATGSYYQLVHTVDPERRETVPAPVRFLKLVYLVLIAIAAGLLLLLPIVLQ